MEKIKRCAMLLLVAAMISSVFAGCGGEKANDENASTATAASSVESSAPSTTEEEDPLKYKLEISLALWDIGQAIDNSKPDAVRDKIYNDLNITIKPMNVTWDDWTQKIQIWAVSDQLPDAFATDLFGTANYNKWIDQGLIHELPSDLSPYPELQKLYDSPGFDIYKYPMGDENGKLYAIPRLNHMSADAWRTDCGIQIRKDWMQKVGITKEPENMDEFISLMKAFADNDCNENGKKDEIGLTMGNPEHLGWFFLGYEPGVKSGHWVKDPNDPSRWIPAFMTNNALEGMKALKKLYDAGGMDKDFATIKGEEGRDKYAASTAGAYAHDLTPDTLYFVKQPFEKMPQNKGINYDDSIILLKPFKAPDGNYYRHIANPAWSETYISAKCDDKKVDRILRLMNYYLSDDGYNLITFGLEGTDWHKEGDKIVLTPKTDADGKVIPLTINYPIIGAGFLMEWSGTRQWTNPTTQPALQKMSSDLNEWLQANAKPVPTDLRIDLLDVPGKDKATWKLGDDIIKCVLSKDVEKTWNDLVSNYMSNGYDKYIDAINAKCAELGIKPQ